VSGKRVFDLAVTDPMDGYRLVLGLVVPRPIGWIGTVRPDGTYNLAPFSFFNMVAGDPPTVLFSGGKHPDRPKDSVALAAQSGEFTVNIVSETVVDAMNVTSGRFEADVDEFAIAGLTAVPGTVVAAPMVAESPANLECRVTHVIDIGAETGNTVVFGEVLVAHVIPEVLDGTRVDTDALRAVGRMAGYGYIRTRDRFEVPRPSSSP
jgi:flavin reductase (DIM6/NTAB) family NADH-FMN oxidoreductase RutF